MPELDEVTAGFFEMFDVLKGFLVTKALYAVVRLGVPDALANGPLDAEDIAARVGADPNALRRVMRALATVGIFAQRGASKFELTPLGALLQTSGPHSLSFLALHYGGDVYRIAGESEHAVRTGEPVFGRVLGLPTFEYYAAYPERAQIRNKALAHNAATRLDTLEGAYPWETATHVIDVAGGLGFMLAGLLKRRPHLRGTLFEVAHIAEKARGVLASEGVADRCEVIVGDFFQSVPAGAGVYFMSLVLHDWNDDDARRILVNCRRAMGSGARLLIFGPVLGDNEEPLTRQQNYGIWLDLIMLFGPGGQERTRSEMNALLASAGFDLVRVVLGDHPFVEASPQPQPPRLG